MNQCQQYSDQNAEDHPIVHYVVRPDKITAKGIEVDDSGTNADLDKIDHLIDELAACLKQNISRCSLVVKVVNDARPGPGGDEFPCDLPPRNLCRGAVEAPNILVVPPDLMALKEEAIHLIKKANDGDGNKAWLCR
jgi:hypothetical protein